MGISSLSKAYREQNVKVDVPTVFVRNSFCRLVGFDSETTQAVADALTYHNDEIEQEKQQVFRLMKIAKARENSKMLWLLKEKLKHLDEEEWVCWLKQDQFPTGHIVIVLEKLEEIQARFELVDERVVPEREHTFRWYNQPDPLRYYQREMVDLGINIGRGVFEASVASGKSLVMTTLIKELGVTTLVVIPSNPLLHQTLDGLELHFGAAQVEHVTSDKVKSGKKLKPIRVTTPQTLASLKEQGLLRQALDGVGAIHADEVHHAGSKTYTDLLPEFDSIYYRFGYSGTFLRNDSKTLDMWGFLSNKLYFYPPYKATEEGFITPVELRVYKVEGKRSSNYQYEYDQNYSGGKPKTSKGKKSVVSVVGDFPRHVQRVLSETPSNEQVLILVDRKDKVGLILHEYLKAQGIENTYISGNDKKDVQKNALRAFNEKKIRLLIGSTVIGEGIDVYSTQHLIMARGGKSEIAIVQAIGRCVRLSEGKTKSYVHDFYFKNTRYLSKHLKQRVSIFKNQFAGKVFYIDPDGTVSKELHEPKEGTNGI